MKLAATITVVFGLSDIYKGFASVAFYSPRLPIQRQDSESYDCKWGILIQVIEQTQILETINLPVQFRYLTWKWTLWPTESTLTIDNLFTLVLYDLILSSTSYTLEAIYKDLQGFGRWEETHVVIGKTCKLQQHSTQVSQTSVLYSEAGAPPPAPTCTFHILKTKLLFH